MLRDLLRTEQFPTIWCPGCGIGILMVQVAQVMVEMGLDHTNSVLISGIGCTGRMAGYMNVDSVYTLHGRTLPVAEAVKMVRPDLKVIVISGDGDLTSIGGNHLLHTARRNAPLTVICNNNAVYGLTGGHAGPTTPKGARTISSPAGTAYEPVNLQQLMKGSETHFYARSTVYHQFHLRRCIKDALDWPGFAFVDVTSQCIENYGRRLGFKTGYEMLAWFREKYKLAPDGAETLEPFQLGTVRKVGAGAGAQ